MSSFYKTKALGRDWLPPPASRKTSRTRFGTWPLVEQQHRKVRGASPPTPASHAMAALQIRGRLWERAMIGACIIIVLFYVLARRPIATFGLPTAGGYLSRWREGHRRIEVVDSVTWADFAYSTYATGPQHLCNSVMLMESLLRVGAKADRLLLYTDEWDVEDSHSPEARLLRQARDQYGVQVKAVRVARPEGVEHAFWAEGFTKWLAFNQTQYQRVLAMDSDATVLRPLDELFLMPPAPVAIPRAYWLNDSLSAQLTLVQPAVAGFQAIQNKIKLRKPNDYDTDIVNAVYGSGSAIIPHRPYNLVTGEFRARSHAKYLGSRLEKWDAEAVIQEAKYVHFSDWPLPKPWEPHTQQQWDELRPRCANGGDCSEFRIWTRLYEEFRQRRKDVCGAEFDTWSKLEQASHEAPSGSGLGDLAIAEALGLESGSRGSPAGVTTALASSSGATAQAQVGAEVVAAPKETFQEVEMESGTVVQVVVVDAEGKLQPDAVASEEDIKVKMAGAGLGEVKWRAKEGGKSRELEAKMGGLR